MSTLNTFAYSTVTGYFIQDDSATVAETFEFITSNFGLLERAYEADDQHDDTSTQTQWQRFERQVKYLNEKADKQTNYKVLYLGRHGQGHHNVAERRYGRAEWDKRYWAKQDGDSIANWVDPHLTDVGKQQAQAVHAFWKHQITLAKTPVPERYYTSPLYRCLQTANLTFANLKLPSNTPYKPLVKEYLREVNGVHTCDKRSTKSSLVNAFPNVTFEPDFTEHDELWSATHRETNDELDARMQKLLDDVFINDESTFISFTAHSAAISSLLRVLWHREFRLPTGAVIPVLVKAEKVY